MDYLKHYNLLIERARGRVLVGYQESHHIVPRCMGGSDLPENLVNLTAEEHYVAHQLLVKMYPGNHLILYAAQMMTVENEKTHVRRPHNKLYGWLKRRIVETRSKQMTGRKHSEETKRKIGAAHKGRWIGRKLSGEQKLKISQSLTGRKREPMSAEQRRKMSMIAKQRHQSPATKAKISASLKGRIVTDETKAKMRKPKSPEMRAKLSATRRAMFSRTKQIQQ